MRILYLSFVSLNQKGVRKKLDYQIKALRKLGNVIYEANMRKIKNYDYFYFNTKKILRYDFFNINKIDKILKKIKDYIIIKKISKEALYKEIDTVYIRKIQILPWVIKYLKFLKKINKKIILEVPTYPYDGEIKKENIFTKMDRKYREQLYKYVDKIVTYSNDKEIWGIPCINISNGIDLESVKIITKNKKNKDNVVFISVSNCSFWHGIDRFLNSLVEYKKKGGKEKILFNIVGEGPETLSLKKIVGENPIIKDMVSFHGFKLGKELDMIYNQSDLGIGSLGRHRNGIKYLKSLKNREYIAKGLPIVYSECDLDFDKQKFVYKVSSDETLINIEKLIKWYKVLEANESEIRNYAENFSWNIQMEKVIKNT